MALQCPHCGSQNLKKVPSDWAIPTSVIVLILATIWLLTAPFTYFRTLLYLIAIFFEVKDLFKNMALAKENNLKCAKCKQICKAPSPALAKNQD